MVPVLAYDNPIIMSRPTTPLEGSLWYNAETAPYGATQWQQFTRGGGTGTGRATRREQEEGARRQVAHQAQVGILHSQSAVVTLVLRRWLPRLRRGRSCRYRHVCNLGCTGRSEELASRA